MQGAAKTLPIHARTQADTRRRIYQTETMNVTWEQGRIMVIPSCSKSFPGCHWMLEGTLESNPPLVPRLHSTTDAGF